MIYSSKHWLITAKQGPWTDRDFEMVERRFGIKRSALEAPIVKAPPLKPQGIYERIADAKRLREELKLIDDGIPPAVAERLVSER